MPLIRLHSNVPETYVNQSRDFQLMCHLYDCIINGVKFDIDSIENIIDTSSCSTILLQLLQTKIGFFTNIDITDEDLRYVLDAFPILLRYKGSRKAIIESVNVFLKLNHLKTGAYVEINNDTIDQPYTVKIGIESEVRDTSILDAIWRYILPTGYDIYYYFYSGYDVDTPIKFNESITFTPIGEMENSMVYGAPDVDSDITKSSIGAVMLSDACNIVEGYYYDGEFYSDASHTSLITPVGFSNGLFYHDNSDNAATEYYVHISDSPLYSPAPPYKINMTVINGSYSISGNKEYVNVGESVNITITADSGYNLPAFVSNVRGAQYSYESSTGILTIMYAYSTVQIVAQCN